MNKIILAILVAAFGAFIMLVSASPGTAVVRPGSCSTPTLPPRGPIIVPPPIHTALTH